MLTLTNSEDQDEMSHNATFHQGLHCLLRLKRYSETEIQFLYEKYNPLPLYIQYNLCKTATQKRSKLVLKTNYRLMQGKSIAEGEHSAIL